MKLRIRTLNLSLNYDYIASSDNFAIAMSNFNQEIIIKHKIKYPLQLEITKC